MSRYTRATASGPPASTIRSQPRTGSLVAATKRRRADANRLWNSAGPNSTERFLICAGAKNSSDRAPGSSVSGSSRSTASQWLKPTELLRRSPSPRRRCTLGDQPGVPGQVHQNGRHVRRERRDLLVRDHAVVRSEPFDEPAVPSRGQPDHLERDPLAPLSLGEEEGQAIGGLARSARNENDTGAEQRVVEEPVVQREGGDEERAQQRLLGFGRLGVGGIRGGSDVAVVERREYSQGADAVDEAERAHARGISNGVGRHRGIT